MGINFTNSGVVLRIRRTVFCVCAFTDRLTGMKRTWCCGRVAVLGYGIAWLR